MIDLIGRKKLVDLLASLGSEGETVLVYGPWGIGKTVILGEVARKVQASGKRCEVWPETGTFQDVALGLAQLYPEVQLADQNHRRIRNAFRLAIEADPGVLVLDHFIGAGTAMKGFLRHLRLSGLGIIIAADVEHPRDHERLRHMRLAHRELEVPPLPLSDVRVLLDDAIRDVVLPRVLLDDDLVAVMKAARGRPGRIRPIVRRLSDPRYWCSGKVLAGLLEIDTAMEVSRLGKR